MKRILRSNDGSTLLMVIIMAAVLTVLGVALFSMATMNVQMKYTNARAKMDAYYAESGFEEFKAYLNKEVYEVMTEAKNSTATELGELYNDLKVSSDGNVKFEPTDKPYKLGLSTNPIVIDEAILKKLSDDIYRYYFIQSINNRLKESEINTNILPKIKGVTEDGVQCSLTIGSVSPFSLIYDGTATFTIHNLQSSFTVNGIQKTVSANFVIHSNIEYPSSVQEDHIVLANNPIWQNALVAQKDIVFKGGTSEITGDIYAKGDFQNVYDKYGNEIRNFMQHGLEVQSGEVTVKGDIVSECSVQTTGADANLTVDGAATPYGVRVYCNTLSTQSLAENSRINIVKGNLYTLDDIELNAKNSDISIIGNYYGLSGGTFPGGEMSHDKSSAIVINAPLRGYLSSDPTIGATLTIDSVDETGSPTTHAVEGDAAIGTWIPGVTYAQIYPDVKSDYFPYQTGESVAVQGNYLVYSIPLSVDDATATSIDSIIGTSSIDYDGTNMTFTDDDLPTPFDSLRFALGFKSNPTIKLTTFELKKYLQITYLLTPELLKLANPDALSIDKYGYSLGSYIEVDPSDSNKNVMSFGTIKVNYENFIESPRYDYFYYLQNSTNTTVLNKHTASDGIDINEYVKTITEQSPGNVYNILDAKTDLNEIVDMNNYGTTTRTTYYVNDPSETAVEVVSIYQNDQDVYIYGEGATKAVTGDHVIDATSTGYLQGCIITNGDVHIYGKLNYTGTIIAGGDIEVNGNLNIKNSDEKSTEYLARLIAATSLKPVFDKKNAAPSGATDIIYDNSDVIWTDDYKDLQLTYNDYIDIQYWRVK